VLLAVCLAAAGCSGDDAQAREAGAVADQADKDKKEGDEDGEKKAPEAVPVELVTLSRGAIEAVLRYTTHLEAEEEVAVLAQAARQVRQLLVEEGQRVGKGQVLLRLQDEEQRTALAKVEGQLAKARREHERQKKLFANQLIAEQAFNESTYELEQLELAHDEAQRALSYTQVRAPIAGTVTRRLVGVGDHISVNQHLFDIVDFESIVARIHVPEKELGRLAVGQAVRIVAPALGPAEPFAGRVERLSPVVDPQTGTIKVTVEVPQQEGLRPGMYVDVALVTAVHSDALLVPKKALVYDADQVFVFRLKPDGKHVQRLRLVPRLEDRANVEPAGGLAPGDRVVVAGQAGLKDGALVRLAGKKA
jgi:membrane fusion protein (multidrug efflux system)